MNTKPPSSTRKHDDDKSSVASQQQATITTTIYSASPFSSEQDEEDDSILVHTTTGGQERLYNTHISPSSNIYNFLKHATPQVSGPSFGLTTIWEQLDDPYGKEFPISIPPKMVSDFAYFVPHLSAIQLFKHAENNPFFEYFETAKPDLRTTLLDKMQELHSKHAMLQAATSDDLDAQRSWFCIAWYPILCHAHTAALVKGQVLTFHSLQANSSMFAHQNQENVEQEQQALYLPVIGFLLYKARNDFWFERKQEHAFRAPVYLMRACVNWLKERNAQYVHSDYVHIVQNSESFL